MTDFERFRAADTTVGVIGLGYIGLPLARAFCDAGLSVLGFDTDASKIAQLGRGECYLRHLGPEFAAEMLATGRFEATGDDTRLGEPDALLICVPTPLDGERKPDLSHVEGTADRIAQVLRRGQLVVLESTSYPGTAREVLQPRLERGGLVCGRDFFLASSPERIDPGRESPTLRAVPKLVGGVDARSTEAAATLYARVVDEVVRVSSSDVAESAKLLENVYRAVNIALVNELKTILTALDIDVWEVIEAASTKPFGFQAFQPGPGWGGHCIPIDPFYLAHKAREVGRATRFVELAGEINRAMPDFVAATVRSALAEDGRALQGARVLLLGLAYKPDVDDVRESPAFELMARLADLGACVDYNDPHVARTPHTRRHDFGLESVDLSAESIASYDCLVIVTDHSAYEWEPIVSAARLIVDTRNALAGVRSSRARIVNS